MQSQLSGASLGAGPFCLVGCPRPASLPSTAPPLLHVQVLSLENPELFKWLTGQLEPPAELQANRAYKVKQGGWALAWPEPGLAWLACVACGTQVRPPGASLPPVQHPGAGRPRPTLPCTPSLPNFLCAADQRACAEHGCGQEQPVCAVDQGRGVEAGVG